MEQLLTANVLSTARAELNRAENPVVSIVIPHYYRYDLLHACLSTVFDCGAKILFEVIVVANGSPEDSLQQLQAWRPRTHILRLEPNQGFSHACNAGVRAARGRYIVVLNDDTTVTPGWLDEMVAYLRSNPSVGITGPKLLYPQNDSIQHCGTVFNERSLGEHIYRHQPANFAAANKPRYYRALTGACLLLEKLLGGCDTSYHGTGGCEDTDLCFKILQRGRMVAYCPQSIVYHP
jgi:GT2 family glycosyltransferase